MSEQPETSFVLNGAHQFDKADNINKYINIIFAHMNQ